MKYGITQGDAGDLEWMLAGDSPKHLLVMCHPHPLYGGSLFDAVVEIVCRVAQLHGISTVRFNFRGVDKSMGTHDQGVGEVADLASIVGEFKQKFKRLTVGGYSFGARVALNFAAQTSDQTRLVLFAPPTKEPLPEIHSEVHAIVGDADPFSSNEVISTWTNNAANRYFYVIDDADHGLAVNNTEIQSIVSRILAA